MVKCYKCGKELPGFEDRKDSRVLCYDCNRPIVIHCDTGTLREAIFGDPGSSDTGGTDGNMP
jgi:DNA-directed RNA polymerase subunit RPC12/RpoP